MLQKSYVGSSLSNFFFFFETTLWRWIPFLYFEWWSECHFMNSREEFLITVCRHSWTFFYLHFLSCIWNPCLFLNGFILILLHRQLVGYQKLLWQHLRTWNTAGKVLHFPLYFCYSIVYWIIHIVFEPSCGLVVQLLICTVYPIPFSLGPHFMLMKHFNSWDLFRSADNNHLISSVNSTECLLWFHDPNHLFVD